MSVSSVVAQGVSFLKTNLIPVVNAERQKIIAVASIIFGSIIAYATVKRCCFKAEKITDVQGRILEGKVIDGKLFGKGSITYSYGDGTIREEGNFKASLLDGKGKVTFNGVLIENGEYKEGVIQRGQRKPYRKDTLTQGTLKEGDFNEDRKLHGKGNVKHSNGDKEDGIYENGVLIEGTKIYSHGRQDIGKFLNGDLHGPNGKQIFADGAEYYGNFNQGQLDGEGERRFPETDLDGSRWIKIEKGMYKEGAPTETYSVERISTDPLSKRCFRMISAKLNTSCTAITSVFRRIKFACSPSKSN